MEQSATDTRQRMQFTRLDRTLLVAHGLLIAVFGVLGMLGADDPNWRGLQRLAVMLIVGLWLAGLAAAAVVARYVRARWARAVVLAVGPAAALLVLVAMVW